MGVIRMTYTDYDSLFEWFSIMTVDGKLSDEKALEKLTPLTTPLLYHQLEEFIKG